MCVCVRGWCFFDYAINEPGSCYHEFVDLLLLLEKCCSMCCFIGWIFVQDGVVNFLHLIVVVFQVLHQGLQLCMIQSHEVVFRDGLIHNADSLVEDTPLFLQQIHVSRDRHSYSPKNTLQSCWLQLMQLERRTDAPTQFHKADGP